MPAIKGETAPAAPRALGQGIQWEFDSVIIDDPSLGKHIEKPVYKDTLKRLTEEGWELVSAIPVIYTEEQNNMFLQTYVEAYRLFLKRPRRL